MSEKLEDEKSGDRQSKSPIDASTLESVIEVDVSASCCQKNQLHVFTSVAEVSLSYLTSLIPLPFRSAGAMKY